MTPQEQQLLQDLTAKINQTTLPGKDPEAEQFLTQSLGRNPDALYILAQTVLVQNYALSQARQQLAQQQAPLPPQKHTSFLGNLLGMNDEPAPPPLQQQYAPVNYAPPPQYQQPQYAQPMQYAAPQQQGGFLQSAMRTATGVAAGALAFQGIESLMGGFEHHAGYGSGLGNFGAGQPREEVINNYYGDNEPNQDKDTGFRDRLSNDLEDRRDDTHNATDTSSFADSDESIDDATQSSDDTQDDNFDPSGDDSSF